MEFGRMGEAFASRACDFRMIGEGVAVMRKVGLTTGVLKEVSRSFYLSLRFLPSGFRDPVSLGYLLARASDTLADAGNLSLPRRRQLLAGFGEWVKGGKPVEMPDEIGLPAGEAVLLERLDESLLALDQLPSWQQEAVRKVVGIIIEGQRWDLDRFEGTGVVGLESDEELRRYTYQVAGCVGEFWTEIGLGEDREFARASREDMMRWGQAFGRSLQLINILRDIPEDWENGRCYLPGARTQAELLVERGRWIKEARQGLDAAFRYADSVNGKRLRFATILPALIGRETLARLDEADWEEWQGRVKVSRKEIYRLMGKALRFSL